MAYEVTATKYRPQTFNELVGQEFVTSTLKNSIQNNRIANAYLLSGPRGVGKTSTARIIAKSLNCINGPTVNPCNICDNCKTITMGNNTDVIEIDGASNTGINDVRKIQEEIIYPPVNSKYKIYIIDEVHMLSISAFNALLKTIEEPPHYVVFIFATTEINEVLPTIRSRCQQFNLRLIPIDIIYNSLINVLKKDNIKYEEEAIKWIAYEGKGSLRDAYTLLDQVVSFCENDITMNKIREKLGLIGEDKISSIVINIINKKNDLIFKEYYNLLEAGISPEQLIEELIKFFRNILLKKANYNFNKYTELNSLFYTDFILNSFNFEDIENILDILFQYYEKSRYSIDFEIEMEICLLKLTNYKEFIRPGKILSEINNLKNQLLNKNQTINNTNTTNEIINQKEDEKKELINKPVIVKKEPENSEIIKMLKSKIAPTNSSLINALNNIKYIEEIGNKMILYFSQEIYYDTAMSFKDLILREIRIFVQKDFNLEIIYKPELKNQKNLSISEINIQKIKTIFGGKEI